MKKLPWKKIAVASAAFVVLVFCRAAVSLARVYKSDRWRLPAVGEDGWLAQWQAVLLPAIQKDPWVYVGFAVAAIGIIAWAMIPPQKPQPDSLPEESPPEEIQETQEPPEP